MPGGRPRKPTALKIAEGNRGRRKLNPDAEPQPVPGCGSMPSGLSDWGRKIWRSLTDELDRLGLLTVVDHAALCGAVVGADQAHSADATINALQKRIRSGKANQEHYYRLSIMNSVSKKGWQQYAKFGTEFGLTPASRSRLAAADGAGSLPAPTAPTKLDPIEQALCDLPVQ